MTNPIREFWINGRAQLGSESFDVHQPWDGTRLATVSVPSPSQVEEAIAGATEVASRVAQLPAYVRAEALAHVSRRITDRADELTELIVAENGKPVKWARVEVTRAASTFRWAAEEARRWSGEIQRLDTDVSGTGRLALVRRQPRGPVLGIAPFNFPLNLVAHKVAPALAVGAPIVLKPAPKTPLSALLLGELLAETKLPAGMWSILTVPNERAQDLVTDERLPVVSFTGSGPVGWSIRDAVPRKHVTLELGGNAAVLVCRDFDAEPDLEHAAERIATFANYQAGQSCVSVQRVLVDQSLLEAATEKIVAAVEGQRSGNPWDDATDVGPLINEASARRVEEWVDEAMGRGARVLTGGKRDGASYAPTVLTDVPADVSLGCEEVFGPVLTIEAFDGLDDGLAKANASRYGLQAGIFTRDTRVAFKAYRELEVGGLIVGDVPTYRAEQMPYGGAKESGIGREGLRFAMEDYTYERVMVLSGLDL